MLRFRLSLLKSGLDNTETRVTDWGFSSLFVRDTNQLPRSARTVRFDMHQSLGMRRTLTSRPHFERWNSFRCTVLRRCFWRNADQ
jgi:hypothetical protein